MVRRGSTALGLVAALGGAPAAADGQWFQGGDAVTVRSDEVREGDLYTAGETVRIDGRLNGDLVTASRRVQVDGRVDGDLFAAAAAIDIRGPIGDSTRVIGQSLYVDAAIDGDLLAATEELVVTENARIAGFVAAAASRVEIDGTVENGLRLAGGEVVIRGTVHGDADVIADGLDLAPDARITGDLEYRGRTPLSAEAAARVEGTVRFDPQADETEERGTRWGVVFWFWQVLAALLTGVVVVGLCRGVVQQLAASIAEQTTLGALLGFAAFLLVPVAAGVATATLVGLPVGLAAFLLFGLALYAAKLATAVWMGDRLLGLAGRPGASPHAAMAVGVVVLYVLFAVPWVGGLVWLAATWLGLGAMVVVGRRHLEARAGAA